MDLSKSYEFFNPEVVTDRIHIIGCGSVGSTVAELLARFGLVNFSLYDFDVVEDRNLVNQMFTTEDLYKDKVEQVKKHILEINPEAEEHIKLFKDGWSGQRLAGYIFLCVDNIDLRRRIVMDNKFNTAIKAVFDFRTGLTNAQHYAADWSVMEDKKLLLNTMNFTHEEAMEATPMSACHVPMCVAPTVRLVCNVGVANFVNFIKNKDNLKKAMIMDAFSFMIEEI